MKWLTEMARRLTMLLHRRQFDADLEEEMRLHLELRQQEHVDAGMSAEDARFAARRRFGNTTALQETSHVAWGWEWLENLVQDASYGVRAMRRSPGVTLVALLSLALGIGANTAIFSLLDAVLLRSLPVKNPQQLVLLGQGEMRGIGNDVAFTELSSNPYFRQFRQRNTVFSDVAGIFSLNNNGHGFVEG